MKYTIVVDGIADNVIEGSRAFILANRDDDFAVEGEYPIGYEYVHTNGKGRFIDPNMHLVPAEAIVPTTGAIYPDSPPDTYLHKSWFMERLIPYANDIKIARAANATLDAYFNLLDQYKGVDVTWKKTIDMINDAELIIKLAVPGSTISAAALLLPRQSHEIYRVGGAQ